MSQIISNMSGTVLRVLVQPGETVAVDQDVLVLESMKMEMNVASTEKGRVKEVKVNPEDFVQEGQVLITLE